METPINYKAFTQEELQEDIRELKKERSEALHRITEIDKDLLMAKKELEKR